MTRLLKVLFDCTAITTWVVVVMFGTLYALNIIYSERPPLPKLQDRVQQSDIA